MARVRLPNSADHSHVKGGFQLEFEVGVGICRVINHMTCYNSSALIQLMFGLPLTNLQSFYRLYLEYTVSGVG